jgi:hypothetical protein
VLDAVVPADSGGADLTAKASHCTELESGGRMIDAMTNTLLPTVSGKFLKRVMEVKRTTMEPLSHPFRSKRG